MIDPLAMGGSSPPRQRRLDSSKAKKRPESTDASDELMESKVAALNQRIENLREENFSLKTKLTKAQKDLQEFSVFVDHERSTGDQENTALRRRIEDLEALMESQKHSDEVKYQKQLREKAISVENTVREYKLKLQRAEEELQKVEAFRKSRQIMEENMRALELKLETQKQQHIRELQELQAKAVHERGQLLLDNERQLEAYRAQAVQSGQGRKESITLPRMSLNADGAVIPPESFTAKYAMELQCDVDQLQTQVSQLQQEKRLFCDKEAEYARKTASQARLIKELQLKVKELEADNKDITREAKKAAESKAIDREKFIQELHMDVHALKQLVRLKNKELRTIRTLGQSLLDQRTEIEEFLMEALEQVKDEVAKEKELARYFGTQIIGGSEVFRLPEISNNNGNETPATTGGTPVSPLAKRKVTIQSLPWKEKEKVLRILFAQINGVTVSKEDAPEKERQ